MIQNDNIAVEGGTNSGVASPCAENRVDSITITSNDIFVENDTIIMTCGETTDLNADVNPDGATNINVTWESSNSYVASVTAGGMYGVIGTVSANHPGVATITARQHSGANIVGDTFQVTVESQGGKVNAIKILPSALTLDVGQEAWLNVRTSPKSPANGRLRWANSNTDVVAFNSNNGKVLGKGVGTAVLTACATDGSEVLGQCRVSVGRELVVISRDSEYSITGSANERNYNKVEFTDSGKVWHCIDEDTIFNPNNVGDSVLSERSNYNFYTNYHIDKEDNSVITTYTSDELRLLYAIDPYGVADYVQRYAGELSGSSENPIRYKEQVFQMLFGRSPKHYVRTYDGQSWNETTSYNSLVDVLSEAELIFGGHPMYNMHSQAQIISLVLNVVGFILRKTPGVSLVCNVVSSALLFVVNGESPIDTDSVLGYALDFDEMSGLVNVAWMNDLLDVLDITQSLIDVLNYPVVDTTYFKNTLEYCYDETGYEVVCKNDQGQMYTFRDMTALM